MRDDFSENIKRELAKRVAFSCSNPDCRNKTIGPQEGSNGTVNVGVAAHIKAASARGPRYDISQDESERSGQINGIWLCQICAKLIDSDVKRFPSSILEKWKVEAEYEAMQSIGKPPIKISTSLSTNPEQIPRLDVAQGVSHSGGADGHFIVFQLKNDGNDTATNIRCYLSGDEVDEIEINVPHTLSPSSVTHEIRHNIGETLLFKQKINNLRLIFHFKSSSGVNFEAQRELLQENRADGNFNIKDGPDYSSKKSSLKFDIQDINFSLHSRTEEGVADSFSITIPILIRNFSSDTLTVKEFKSRFILEEGYQCQQFGIGFNTPTDIPGRGVIEKSLQFSISIIGRENNLGTKDPDFLKNLQIIMDKIFTSKFLLLIEMKIISLIEISTIKKVFDLSTDLISKISK